MSQRREIRHLISELLLQICQMEWLAVAYHCTCGQHLILANFEPSILRQKTRGIDVMVLRASDHVACPACSASLAFVWQAAERAWAEGMLARFRSLDVEGLVEALQTELRGLQEARLKCN